MPENWLERGDTRIGYVLRSRYHESEITEGRAGGNLKSMFRLMEAMEAVQFLQAFRLK